MGREGGQRESIDGGDSSPLNQTILIYASREGGELKPVPKPLPYSTWTLDGGSDRDKPSYSREASRLRSSRMQWDSGRVGVGLILFSGLVPGPRFKLTLGLGLGIRRWLVDWPRPGRVIYRRRWYLNRDKIGRRIWKLTLRFTLWLWLGDDVGLRPRARLPGVRPGRFVYTSKVSRVSRDGMR